MNSIKSFHPHKRESVIKTIQPINNTNLNTYDVDTFDISAECKYFHIRHHLQYKYIVHQTEDINDKIIKEIKRLSDGVVVSRCNSLSNEIENEAYRLWVKLEVSIEKFRDILFSVYSMLKLTNVAATQLLSLSLDTQTYIRNIRSNQEFYPESLRLYICPKCFNITAMTSSRNNLNSDRTLCPIDVDIPGSKIYHTSILPLIPRISSLLNDPDMMSDLCYYTKEEIISLLYLHNSENYYIPISDVNYSASPINLPTNIPKYFYGSSFYKYTRPLIEKADIFLYFSVTSDGISVISKPQKEDNKSTYPITVKLLNYFQKRKVDNRRLWVYSCPVSSMVNPVIEVLCEELAHLEQGMNIQINKTNEYKRVVGILLDVYGDFPAMSKMANTPSSSSTCPCRFCNLSVSRSRTNIFHSGIKCCYEESVCFRDENQNITTFHIPIYRPNEPLNSNNMIIDYLDESIINANVCVSISPPLEMPTSSIYKDSLLSSTPSYRSSEVSTQLLNNTNEVNVDIPIKGFKKLSYFDTLESCSLDPMHLLNNVATSLMELLWNYPKTKVYSNLDYILTKNDSLKFISKISLSEDNKTIIKTRMKNMNMLYNADMYQISTILDDLNFYSCSSHSRILFFSRVLPLLMSDFVYKDSPLVLVIELFGSIICDCMNINPIIEKNQLLCFEQRCIQFVSILESILPSVLISVQMHSIKHLALCIKHTGSLYYTSTWESERSYSTIKRITKGKYNYNESVLIKVQDQESIQVHSKLNCMNKNIDNIKDKRYTSLECKEVFIDDCPLIYSFKGIEKRSFSEIFDRDILSIILLLSSTSSCSIRTKLFSEIFDDSITPYIREEKIKNEIDIQKKIMENFKSLKRYCYNSITVNGGVSFRINKSDAEKGTKDNSYIMQSISIQLDSGEYVWRPVLYKSIHDAQNEIRENETNTDDSYLISVFTTYKAALDQEDD
ncbi:hypothetical protein WA158_006974 [Blastocystis sp. Blastoise]